jgi:hypothetical protein
MTQDEIIEMATQAELNLYVHDLTEKRYIEVIEVFAKLVAAKEREACAKACENMTLEWKNQPHIAKVELSTMMDCALAIRTRGEA